MEILIIGREGQLSRAFQRSFNAFNFNFTVLGRKDTGDNPEIIRQVLQEKPFHFVVNTAAYTQVDLAESEKEAAYKGNVLLPQTLARISAEAKIPLIHFSTDYVYSGQGEKPWRETDLTGPLNYYGQSKLEGEQEVQKLNPLHLIFRTCWLYDKTGQNFPNKILSLAQNRSELKIVADQFGSPTNALDVATSVTQIISQGIGGSHYGVYNICNQGYASWFDFASQIVNEAKKRGLLSSSPKLTAVSSNEFPTAARRPLNSRLSTEKLKQNFQITLPSWQEGLRQYFEAHD